MNRIEFRTPGDGKAEVWLDDTNPGGRAYKIGTIDPEQGDNMARCIALIATLAAGLGVPVKVR